MSLRCETDRQLCSHKAIAQHQISLDITKTKDNEKRVDSTLSPKCKDCKDGSSYTSAEQRMNECLICRQHILKVLTVIYCCTWKLYSRVLPRTHTATFSRIIVRSACTWKLYYQVTINQLAKACMECVQQIKTRLQQ